MGTHSMESTGVVSKPVSQLIWVSPNRPGLMTLQNRVSLVNNGICLLINTLGQIGILTVVVARLLVLVMLLLLTLRQQHQKLYHRETRRVENLKSWLDLYDTLISKSAF